MRWIVCGLLLVGVGTWGGLYLMRSHYDAQGTDMTLPAPFDRLTKCHTPLGKPEPGDWLACYEERGQPFREYVDGRRDEILDHGNLIYTVVLGEASPQQRELFTASSAYLECLFGLPVRALDDISADIVPDEARRRRRPDTDEQLLTTYILETLAPPRRPDDCALFVVFTAYDLWTPFLPVRAYGEALARQRAAVCSIYPFGDDIRDRQCLARALKLVSHEVLHLFDMNHCIFYECVLCGANHLGEVDRSPLALCPHCLGKTCNALRPRDAARGTWIDPAPIVARLAAFCRKYKLAEDAELFERQHALLVGQ